MKYYNNFFEWYKEEKNKWNRKHPHDLYDCGIEDNLFKYFILQYLYKGPIVETDSKKLEKIFKRYSSRYKKELIYSLFNKEYKPKEELIPYRERKLSEFIHLDELPDSVFVEFCKSYLIESQYYYDSLGCGQINLDYLTKILEKHSLKFKIEKYLYKLFK